MTSATRSEAPPSAFWIGLCAIGALPRLFELWFFPTALTNRDFSSFYLAAKLGSDAYDPAAHDALGLKLLGFEPRIPFVYPPHLLPFLAPFGALPYWLALAIWALGGLAFFAWAARPYGLPRWLPLALPSTLVCVAYGQIGLWIGGLWLLAFQRKGWALGLLTLKPHIGFLAGIEALRDRRLILPALAALAAAVAISFALFGNLWPDFAAVIRSQAAIDPIRSKFASPLAYGWGGYIAFALAAAVLLSRNFNVFSAATAALLISPYSYHYDMTAANLGFAVALCSDRPLWQRLTLTLGFLAPALTIFGGAIVPPVLLACLYVQSGEPLPNPLRSRIGGGRHGKAAV